MEKEKQENKNPSYLFGPVPSRRLGMSLGVDLVPYKTCTMDCVYCESGCTTELTIERREFFPTEDIINELDSYLSFSPEIDYVTFSGAGEPTLHSGIGKIISFIKDKYPRYRICLLTNGMLLQNDDVFNDVINVDLIVPSLDAPDHEIFERINRPAVKIDFDAYIDSFVRFHKKSSAFFILEIFIIPGLNDSDEIIQKFSTLIKKINPDKVQLNSLDRPGAESWVPKVTEEDMERILAILSKVGNVEIIGKFISNEGSGICVDVNEYKNLDRKILDLLSRRPCTLQDIISSTGLTPFTVEKIIKRMLKKGLISPEKRERGEFFKKVK